MTSWDARHPVLTVLLALLGIFGLVLIVPWILAFLLWYWNWCDAHIMPSRKVGKVGDDRR